MLPLIACSSGTIICMGRDVQSSGVMVFFGHPANPPEHLLVGKGRNESEFYGKLLKVICQDHLASASHRNSRKTPCLIFFRSNPREPSSLEVVEERSVAHEIPQT